MKYSVASPIYGEDTRPISVLLWFMHFVSTRWRTEFFIFVFLQQWHRLVITRKKNTDPAIWMACRWHFFLSSNFYAKNFHNILSFVKSKNSNNFTRIMYSFPVTSILLLSWETRIKISTLVQYEFGAKRAVVWKETRSNP